MNQKILAFAGTKQSGKSSAANFVAGYVLSQAKRHNISLPLPKSFTINDEGKLIVEASFTDSDGKTEIKPAELDLRNRTTEFDNFAQEYIYPYVKIYSFADTLKEFAMRVFCLTENQCYGGDKYKRTNTKIKWSDFAKVMRPVHVKQLKDDGKYDSKMIAREFLQFFGTDVCRAIFQDCWVNDCLSRIVYEGYPFAIIDDCRFDNEVYAIQQIHGKVVYLKRKPYKDAHKSECSITKVPPITFDLIVKNQKMDIREKNQEILDYLFQSEMLSGHIDL